MMISSIDIALPNRGTVTVPVLCSDRSRRVVIRVKENGFVLSVPRNAWITEEELREFLRRSAGWMEKHFPRPRTEEALPDTLFLAFLNCTFPLVKVPSQPVPWAGVREDGEGHLLITGNTDSLPEVKNALRRWLIRKAAAVLLPLGEQLAREQGKEVHLFRTGIQKGSWGKCTSRKIITLNAALLFVPPELVRYVILHELTHLEEMNHSPRFWKRLEERYPGAKEARKLLNGRNQKRVPGWVTE